MAGRRTEPEGHVRVGQIVGSFGLKGGLKISPTTDFVERFDVGSLLYWMNEPHRITESYWHKGQVRVLVEGVRTIEEAESLKWQYVTVPAGDIPDLDEDEFLARDLLGMDVVENGTLLGKVLEIVPSPAHDLIRIEGALIPMVRNFVKSVDTDKRVIEVQLIEGMRPGDTAEEVRE